MRPERLGMRLYPQARNMALRDERGKTTDGKASGSALNAWVLAGSPGFGRPEGARRCWNGENAFIKLRWKLWTDLDCSRRAGG